MSAQQCVAANKHHKFGSMRNVGRTPIEIDIYIEFSYVVLLYATPLAAPVVSTKAYFAGCFFLSSVMIAQHITRPAPQIDCQGGFSSKINTPQSSA